MNPLSKTRYLYHVFGLNIESSIPFLDMPEVEGNPDVTVRYGKVPDTLPDAKIKGVRYQAGPGGFLLRIDNVAKYHVKSGSDILIERKPGAGDEDVLLFLMGSSMGALLHQRNILPLHGSSIEVEGEGIIFIGHSSIGKSTLAGGFHRRGYHLLSDDVCAVSATNGERPHVIPGFPHLKLWADTLGELKQDRKGLKHVRLDKDFEKYFIPFHNVSGRPVPVRSVFLLEATNNDGFEIIQLKGMEKINPLIDNTYRPRFLEGLGGKERHFTQCAAVAGKAAVRKVIRPKRGFLLDELMDLVERNF